MAAPYRLPAEVATVLAQICCHQNQLPQGAPTSPIVSNMICARMDSQLQHLAQINRCTYTRYADDISLSLSSIDLPVAIVKFVDEGGLGPQLTLGSDLISIIRNNGFEVNETKTRLQLRSTRQEVTGLTVNKFPNVQRHYTRQIRAMLHAWNKYGLDNAQKEFLEKYNSKYRGPFKKSASFKDVLKGKISFLGSVRGKHNALYLSYLRRFQRLDPEHKKPPSPDPHGDVREALWILEDENECIQGTGFMLEGAGLITCHHVIGKNTRAFHISNIFKKYEVAVSAQNRDIDLAILIIDCPGPKRLNRALSQEIGFHDEVVLAGFPNYRKGDTAYVSVGRVSSFRQHSSIKRFLIDTAIIAGMSGGPVLNSDLKVIRVAVTGAESASQANETENHGVIPINALDLLRT